MKVTAYKPEYADVWNKFLGTSKNGTFLFDRGYMEYHSERFEDASLMVQDSRGDLVAIFPANRRDHYIISHGGLSYGGLVIGAEIGISKYLAIFASIGDYLQMSGFEFLEYKSIPSIYHRYPSDEDKYVAFVLGAELHRRELSSTILPTKRIPLRKGRKSDLNKAVRNGLSAVESDRWAEFWDVLTDNLRDKHDRTPVHTIEEIKLLHSRYPDHIRLFIVSDGPSIVAGAVIFETSQVVHTQYIGCNESGRKKGALDLLLSHMLDNVFASKLYFNFGISTTDNGYSLNTGLVDFKESFGARSIVQDSYRFNLKKTNFRILNDGKWHLNTR